MTYQNDPNLNRDFSRDAQRDIDARRLGEERNNTPIWIAGAVALALMVGLFAFSSASKNDNVAATNRPAVTAPATTTGSGASTTGSGASTMPNNKGTTPQRDNNTPVAPTAR